MESFDCIDALEGMLVGLRFLCIDCRQGFGRVSPWRWEIDCAEDDMNI
jgi:hypothetical protein